MNKLDYDVIIAGAGPVGLVLALELAAKGVRVFIAEQREEGFMPTVRCNHISSRSMESFRRLGLSNIIRNSGLPGDYEQSVSYRTTTTGTELTRIRIPSRNDRFTERDDGPDGNWPTPEPPHRMNQIFLEPILVEAAQRNADITLCYGSELVGFDQETYGVSAELRDAHGVQTIKSSFLVGCDGGRSLVRKSIGATLSGDPVLQRVQSTYIRAPQLIEQMKHDPTWAMFSLNPKRTGNVYAIDGKERWLVHNYLRDNEPEFDSVDRDSCIRAILGVDEAFEYEVLANEDWIGRRLVTDKMRDGRVFICGDAAHLWVPYAGYGMNAGIADAADLSWLLASVVSGWGGEGMLAAYEAERLPITEQVSQYAMNHCIAMAKQRSSVPDQIEDQTVAGELARKKMGREAYDLNVQQYVCAGLNFGYFYDQSPIITPSDVNPPAYSMSEFTPSSVPGCRVPHFWLSESTSLFDRLGPGYTLLRTDTKVEVKPLLNAAEMMGVPLECLDIDPPEQVADQYPTPLIIVRPDHHVAWRGEAIDRKAAEKLLSIISGRFFDDFENRAK
ncbi:FAD-dependent oxidoreductase [Paracoccus aerodenitrificans]|uniref:FAD-dependent oxidoreductase n=1 Tax=Paracoccus aerodenitrificans TaxID=3017781 RepID=UPI0022F0E05A|nr:FAD-dependent oxidoreductase [Paracoccus aerodenitrificans]WBU63572.1 FAD-dependent oxidoreductase [Paracoccus aerodenitrificans]